MNILDIQESGPQKHTLGNKDGLRFVLRGQALSLSFFACAMDANSALPFSWNYSWCHEISTMLQNSRNCVDTHNGCVPSRSHLSLRDWQKEGWGGNALGLDSWTIQTLMGWRNAGQNRDH